MNMGIRLVHNGDLSQLTKKQLSELKVEDIEDITAANEAKKLELPVDNELLKEAQA